MRHLVTIAALLSFTTGLAYAQNDNPSVIINKSALDSYEPKRAAPLTVPKPLNIEQEPETLNSDKNKFPALPIQTIEKVPAIEPRNAPLLIKPIQIHFPLPKTKPQRVIKQVKIVKKPQKTKLEPVQFIDITATATAIPNQNAAAKKVETKPQPAKEPLGAAKVGEIISISWPQAENKLNDEQISILDNSILKILNAYTSLDLEIISYASDIVNGDNSARRTSLDRALAIENHLIQNDISSKRINIKAMGYSDAIIPSNRVDLLFLK